MTDLTRQLAEARARIAELEAERAEIRQAERERCARLAQQREAEGGEYALAARHIATAIRALPDGDPS